jgi:asparagine synthase (glutamine-hydrolysing)
VPPWLKMNGRESKVLLKQAVRDLLPAPILTRRKRGFDLPMAEWLRGPLQPLLRDLLMAPTARCRALFAPAYVAQLVEEHAASQANHRGRLWTLLCFELWAKEYLPVGAHA